MRICAAIFGVCLSLAQIISGAAAVEYPTRTVRVVNVYAPGGGTDIVMRSIAVKLQEKWRQPVIVENVPGAGTTLGTATVARASPDGYTILVTDISYAIAASYYDNLTYKPESDLVAIGQIAIASHVLMANKSVSLNSVNELISFAKANPKQVIFATPGPGSIDHLGVTLLNKLADEQIIAVPYKGSAPAVIDLVAGRVQFWLGATGPLLKYSDAGAIRPLAVFEDQRTRKLPNVPTVGEAGLPELALNAWYGLFAPAGTPPEIIDKIYRDVAEAIATEDVQRTYDLLSNDPVTTVGPAEFKKIVARDIEKWRAVVKSAGKN